MRKSILDSDRTSFLGINSCGPKLPELLNLPDKGKTMKHISVIFLLGISAIFPRLGISQQLDFQPLPYQDPIHGRNSYAYNAAIGKPTNDMERQSFLDKIKPYVLSAQRNTKIPACAIGGMAAVESGFGFTRTAYFANNIFGRKIWTNRNTSNSWQLAGQPDESQRSGCLTKIIKNYDRNNNSSNSDRLVFNEQKRCDNRYLSFSDYGAAIQDLTGTVLQRNRYKPALNHFWSNIESGEKIDKACEQYICDIAKAGYSHIGCEKYLRKIGPVMKQWNLYDWVVQANTPVGGNP